MNKRIIYIDIDGTICSQTNGDYTKAKPFTNAINKVNTLYDIGNTIIIYTARYMKRCNNNKDKAKKIGYDLTFNQLKSWGLKFHELRMGKPHFDILIDDKAYNYNETWINDL